MTANWQATDRLSFSSTLLCVGSWWDLGRQAEPPDGFEPYIKVPDYTTVNLAATYVLRSDVTLFASIDNLFNKQYEDPAGFLRPGFGIFGGVRLTAGGISSSGLPNTIRAANTTPVAPTHRHAARGLYDG